MQNILATNGGRSLADRLKHVSLAAVVAVSSVGAAAAPLFLSSAASAQPKTVAQANSTVTVLPNSLQGWTTSSPADNRPGGSIDFTKDFGAPANGGVGSLKMSTNDGNAKAQLMKNAPANTLLSSINNLGYSTYRSSSSAGAANQVAAINLGVDINGSAAGGFTTLVYEPVYQPGATIMNDTWQTWNAGNNGIWWSTKDISGATAFTSYVSLAAIKAANPDATVLYYGVNEGTGNPDLVSGVDNFTIGDTTYNFEPTLTPSTRDDCKNNGWQSFNTPTFKNQGLCVSYVEHNSHEVNGDIAYTANSLNRRAWFHMDTANGGGWFVYADANHDWYGVRVNSVKVDGNSAWFAGKVDRSRDGKFNGNWLFAKVTDGKPDQIWGTFTDQTTAQSGVQAKTDPTGGVFNVTRGNLKITREDD